MRSALARGLVQAAKADQRVVLLTGDHGYSLFDEFRQECPQQFLNAGVAEQNLVGVAAGLAKGGFRPVVYGLSAFVPMRVAEQIKLDVCAERLPVLFLGDGAGLVYSTLGISHQCTEDLAVARALPNLAVLSPADAAEMTACLQLAWRAEGPVYLRIGKADRGPVHAAEPRLRWGQLLPVRGGDGPLAWVATGAMVPTALAAAAEWPDSAVFSAPCLKPLLARTVVALCRKRVAVVVLEEHSIHGGLGSALAEITASRAPTWLCRIGVQDRFSEACGSYDHLLTEHRLDVDSVVRRVRSFLTRLPLQAFRRAAQRRMRRPRIL